MSQRAGPAVDQECLCDTYCTDHSNEEVAIKGEGHNCITVYIRCQKVREELITEKSQCEPLEH